MTALPALLLVLAPLQEPGDRPYTLFNPVPREQMRPLVADRPDVTEAAITVDAGHYQLEMSLADWTRERRDDVFVALQTNAKVGVTESADLQLVFEAFIEEDPAGGSGENGFSDLLIRYKQNLWGNDGGDDALALLPFLKVPTGTDVSNDELEGGLAVPYAMTLTDSLSLGLMAQFDLLYDEAEEDHEFGFLHTASLGVALTESTGTFFEYAGRAGGDDYLALFNTGLTYQVNRNLILDGGVRIGLVDEADDLGVFLGFSARY